MIEHKSILTRLKHLYDDGVNITSYLRELSVSESNDVGQILIAYDFQAGTYINHARKNTKFKTDYARALVKVFESFGDFSTILEAGVGEATTLKFVLDELKEESVQSGGFDLSWSRVRYAIEFLMEHQANTRLFTGNMFEIPLQDNAVDIVYTSHSIEPNGGKERKALEELMRITNKYLVLLEPGFEFASDEGKARMKKNGYCIDLYKTVQELQLNVLEYRLFDYSINPLNPTALIIIEKNGNNSNKKSIELACPVTKSPLQQIDNALFSSESLLAYPIIKDVACLLSENAIVASHFSSF